MGNPITVLDLDFPSRAAACNAFCVSPAHLRRKRDEGLSVEEAILAPSNAARYDHMMSIPELAACFFERAGTKLLAYRDRYFTCVSAAAKYFSVNVNALANALISLDAPQYDTNDAGSNEEMCTQLLDAAVSRARRTGARSTKPRSPEAGRAVTYKSIRVQLSVAGRKGSIRAIGLDSIRELVGRIPEDIQSKLRRVRGHKAAQDIIDAHPKVFELPSPVCAVLQNKSFRPDGKAAPQGWTVYEGKNGVRRWLSPLATKRLAKYERFVSVFFDAVE